MDAHYPSDDPYPKKPTHISKKEKEITVEDKKRKKGSGQKRSIDLALKTLQSNNIGHAVTKCMAGDWRCIGHDLDTIIVLVMLAFSFIPQRSHHSFTRLKSRFRDPATATLSSGDDTTTSKVESST